MKKVFLLLFTCCCILFANAQAGSLDTSFNPTDVGFGKGDGANNQVLASVIQPDGKMIIAGSFSTYNGTSINRICRLNADGNLDPTFVVGTGASSTINSIALQPDGKIIIGGDFTNYNSIARERIARLNSDGSLDTTFTVGNGASNTVQALAVQTDGKIVVGGRFFSFNSVNNRAIVRLNTNGSVDISFSSTAKPNGDVYALAIQPDGKIVVGGSFSTYNSIASSNIARLNSDGTVDTSFTIGTGANSIIYVIKIQTDGKILIGGEFSQYNSVANNRIARLQNNGTLDTAFTTGTAASSTVRAILMLSDGRIVIGGDFSQYNTVNTSKIALLSNNGILDTTFVLGTGPDSTVNTIVQQADEKIVVGGSFITYNNQHAPRVVRISTNGAMDTTYNVVSGFNNSVSATVQQTDGKIIVCGSFNNYFNAPTASLLRLNIDGTVDTTFSIGTGFNRGASASKLALQPDGKIIAIGGFTSYNGSPYQGAVRINSNGTLDTTFNIGTGFNNGSVNNLVVQPDGKIIIVGMFTNFNGFNINRIVRLNSDGSRDTTFNPGSGPEWFTNVVRLQTDGKIIIGGSFGNYNNITSGGIARLNTNGSIDTAFAVGTGFNDPSGISVNTIQIQPDGKIIAAGSFPRFNSTLINRVARLNTDGTLDTTFTVGTGANSTIFSSALQADGKVILGGQFTTYNAVNINRLMRLNTDGTLDTTFNVGTGLDQTPFSATLLSDGKLLIGGAFIGYNGIGRNRLARVNTTVHAPVAHETQTICGSGTLANLSIIGANIQWYNAATAGILLASNTTVVNNTTYFASQTVGAIESVSRTAVLVNIGTAPAAPTVDATSVNVAIGGDCIGAGGLYNKTSVYNGKNYYTFRTGGAFIYFDGSKWVFGNPPGQSFSFQNLTVPTGMNPPLTGWTGLGSGCGTGTFAITSLNSNLTFCSGATIASLNIAGTDVKYYLLATSATPLATTDLLVSRTYFVSQTVNGCESSRTAFGIAINPLPAAPTAAATQTFCNSGTIANLTPTPSATIKWYATATGTTPLAATTTLTTATNYFASQTNTNGCESSSRTQVLVTINAPTIPTFNIPSGICIGGVLSPLPTTSSNAITGTWTPALSNTTTTTYTFTPNANQCASTATRTITINPVSNTTVVAAACNSYTWPENNVTYTTSGSYTITPSLIFSNQANWIANATATSSTTHLNALSGYPLSPANPTVAAIGPVNVTISAPDPLYGDGTIISTNNASNAITLNFNPPVYGVAGNFYLIDNSSIPIAGNIILTYSDGTVDRKPTSASTDFFGFYKSTLISRVIIEPVITTPYVARFVAIKNLRVAVNNSILPCLTKTLNLTINPSPTAPTAASAQTICVAGTIADLTPISTASATIKWYASAIATTPLAATNTLVSGNYFASQTNTSGCESASRTQVAVTIGTPAPTGQSIQIYAGTATLANFTVTGTNIKWYAAATGGAELPISTTVTNNVTYYASQTNTCGESATRFAVTVRKISDNPQIVCGLSPTVANILLTPSAGFTAGVFASATSTTALAATSAISSGTYFVEQTREIGTNSVILSGLTFPNAVTTDATGKIIFAESTTAGAIKRMNADGTSVQILRNDDFINDVKVAANGQIFYISRSGFTGGIFKMNADGTGLTTVAPNFSTAYNLTFDSLGRLLVTDSNGNRVVRMNPDGTNVVTITTAVTVPQGIVSLPDDTIVVTSSLNDIVKMNADGTNITTLATGINFLIDIERRASGKLILTTGQTNTGQIRQINADGTGMTTLLSNINAPRGLTIENNGNVVFALSDGASVNRMSLANEISARIPVALSVAPFPDAPIATSPQTYCGGTRVASLTATGNAIKWYNSPTGGIALTPTTVLASGNYFASQTNLGGCESASRTPVAVTVTSTTVIPTVPTSQSFCIGTTVASLAATGTNIVWYNAATAGAVVASNTALVAGNYFASQTVNGCESPQRAQTNITIIGNLVIDAPTVTQPSCATATGSITINVDEASAKNIRTLITGSLDATDNTQTGRLNRFATNISSCATPSVFPNLTSTTGSRVYDSYSFTNNSLNPVCVTTKKTNVLQFDVFMVSYLNSFNPTNLATNYLGDCGSSSFTNTSSQIVPAGATLVQVLHSVTPNFFPGAYTLEVTGIVPTPIEYSIDNGANWQSTPTFSNLVAGNYNAVVRPVSTTCVVSYGANPIIITAPIYSAAPTANAIQSFCDAGTVGSLSVSGTDIKWYDAAIRGNLLSNLTTLNTATNYFAAQTEAGKCESVSRTQVAVVINTIPATPSISANGATTFCQGGSVTLTSSALTGNIWSNGATTQAITVSTSGNYTVRATSANGCQSATSTATEVMVTPLTATPSITANGATTFCQGGNVTLTSSAATGNVWSNGATTQAITVSASGNYTVRATSTSGCQSATSTATEVMVTPLTVTPSISANGTTTFCQGGNVTLTSSAATGNMWSTGATTQSIVVSTSGNYTVRATSANGCQSATSTATEVIVTPLTATPSISANGSTIFCQGGNVTLTSSAATGNVWSNGATTQDITVSASGNYTVRATTNGCQSATSTTTVVTVTPLTATPSISANGSTIFCQGGNVTLTSSAATGNIWSNGATTQAITVSTSGNYTVRSTTNGCQSATSTATEVIVTPLTTTPSISANGTTTFCQGGTVTLTSSASTGNVWSTGATSQSITVSTSGNYTVRASTNGCQSATSTVTVVVVNQVILAPAAFASNYVVGTAITPINLVASGVAGSGYTFSVSNGNLPGGLSLTNGIISGAPTAAATGSYTITATATEGGCSASQTYTFTVTCPNLVFATTSLPNRDYNQAYSQTLSVSNTTTALTYTVSSGSLPAGFTLSSSGLVSGTSTALGTSTFTILATDVNGCSVSNTFSIGLNQIPITVTANAGTKVFGTADPVLTYTVVPALQPGESFTGTLIRIAGANVGTYAINQGTLSAGSNYVINYVGATFTITKAPQTITWMQNLVIGCDNLPTLQLTATASSGLPVVYASQNNAIATISGSTLNIVNQGTVAITASQAGNNNYFAATNVVQPVIVSQPSLIRKHWRDVIFFDNSSNSYSNYQWFKNGVAVSGANQQYFKDNGDLLGTYYATALRNGVLITTCQIVFTATTPEFDIKVMPNPLLAGNAVEVETSLPASALQNAELVVYALSGAIVSQQPVTANKMTVTAPMAQGVYIVRLQLSNGNIYSVNLLVK